MTDWLHLAPKKPLATLILAHGAGAAMDSDFMTTLCEALAGEGIATARFEFPYMAQRRRGGGRRPPDRQAVLLECWREKYRDLKSHGGATPLLIGGKSMGGRMASLVAEELQPDGFCCFGYPFFPPRKPRDSARTAHFKDISVPGLILQGTRDAFGGKNALDASVWPANIRLVWLEEGDHDYKARKSSGLDQEQIIRTAAQQVAVFVDAIIKG